MKKIFFILFFLSGFIKLAIAQDFEYGTVTDEEMDMKSYAKDTSAHAVVLQEFGKSKIVGDLRLVFEYHVKIKIFDSKGFENAKVEVPAYDNYSGIDSISAVTYYKDDNGVVQKIAIDHKNIYPVKVNGYLTALKFDMPGLRQGCVIEYKYQTISRSLDNYHPWYFQSSIPKIYSEYEAHIPAYWDYNASLKGSLKLTKSATRIESNCFTFRGATSDCSVITYGMSNIPAFISEEYITSSRNYVSSINFDLTKFISPLDITHKFVQKEWKDIDYLLKNDYRFGGQLRKTALLKETIEPIIKANSTDLDKAKAIYSYLQKWFKWNNYHSALSENLAKALDKHSGTSGDINLSLVTALKAAGLKADAVLLSTRENGFINPLYPSTSSFNYTIAKLNIEDRVYLLDATDPLLPFGMLPFRCLNDKGRVFSLDSPSYWINLASPQGRKNTYTLDLTLQADGKIKGTLIHYSIGYSAYEKRKKIKTFNSEEEYEESSDRKMAGLKILKSEIVNLDSLDLPLEERYDVEIVAGNQSNTDLISLNPFLMGKIDKNPFKLEDRLYPVDMGMPREENLVLTMHLPSKYTVEAPPDKLSINMPGNGGRFLTNYESDDNSFTFSNSMHLNKPIYDSDEYPYLKEFYNKIIQAEKAEIIFKKKST